MIQKINVPDPSKIADMHGIHIYADPNGSDGNPGTKFSPVKTLERAFQLASNSYCTSIEFADNTPNCIVHLAAGTYYETITMTYYNRIAYANPPSIHIIGHGECIIDAEGKSLKLYNVAFHNVGFYNIHFTNMSHFEMHGTGYSYTHSSVRHKFYGCKFSNQTSYEWLFNLVSSYYGGSDINITNCVFDSIHMVLYGRHAGAAHIRFCNNVVYNCGIVFRLYIIYHYERGIFAQMPYIRNNIFHTFQTALVMHMDNNDPDNHRTQTDELRFISSDYNIFYNQTDLGYGSSTDKPFYVGTETEFIGKKFIVNTYESDWQFGRSYLHVGGPSDGSGGDPVSTQQGIGVYANADYTSRISISDESSLAGRSFEINNDGTTIGFELENKGIYWDVLASAIDDSETTITFDSIPSEISSISGTTGYLRIGAEIIEYDTSNISGHTITSVVRGSQSTTATAHGQGHSAVMFGFIDSVSGNRTYAVDINNGDSKREVGRKLAYAIHKNFTIDLFSWQLDEDYVLISYDDTSPGVSESGNATVYDYSTISGILFHERSQVVDGNTITINDGTVSETFEFDDDAVFTGTQVDISGLTDQYDVVDALVTAINASATLTGVSAHHAPTNVSDTSADYVGVLYVSVLVNNAQISIQNNITGMTFTSFDIDFGARRFDGYNEFVHMTNTNEIQFGSIDQTTGFCNIYRNPYPETISSMALSTLWAASISDVQGHYGIENNSLTSDPQLIKPASGNFHVKKDSPAKGSGENNLDIGLLSENEMITDGDPYDWYIDTADAGSWATDGVATSFSVSGSEILSSESNAYLLSPVFDMGKIGYITSAELLNSMSTTDRISYDYCFAQRLYDSTIAYEITNKKFVSQSITPTKDCTLQSIRFMFDCVGVPYGKLTCKIYDDSAGSPGSLLAVSQPEDIASIMTPTTDLKPFSDKTEHPDRIGKRVDLTTNRDNHAYPFGFNSVTMDGTGPQYVEIESLDYSLIETGDYIYLNKVEGNTYGSMRTFLMISFDTTRTSNFSRGFSPYTVELTVSDYTSFTDGDEIALSTMFVDDGGTNVVFTLDDGGGGGTNPIDVSGATSNNDMAQKIYNGLDGYGGHGGSLGNYWRLNIIDNVIYIEYSYGYSVTQSDSGFLSYTRRYQGDSYARGAYQYIICTSDITSNAELIELIYKKTSMDPGGFIGGYRHTGAVLYSGFVIDPTDNTKLKIGVDPEYDIDGSIYLEDATTTGSLSVTNVDGGYSRSNFMYDAWLYIPAISGRMDWQYFWNLIGMPYTDYIEDQCVASMSNGWIHVACQRINKNEIYLYINGQKVHEDTSADTSWYLGFISAFRMYVTVPSILSTRVRYGDYTTSGSANIDSWTDPDDPPADFLVPVSSTDAGYSNFIDDATQYAKIWHDNDSAFSSLEYPAFEIKVRQQDNFYDGDWFEIYDHNTSTSYKFMLKITDGFSAPSAFNEIDIYNSAYADEEKYYHEIADAINSVLGSAGANIIRIVDHYCTPGSDAYIRCEYTENTTWKPGIHIDFADTSSFTIYTLSYGSGARNIYDIATGIGSIDQYNTVVDGLGGGYSGSDSAPQCLGLVMKSHEMMGYFNFNRDIDLTAGSTYHIVLQSDMPVDASNKIKVLGTDSATFSGQISTTTDRGSTWTAQSGEDLFLIGESSFIDRSSIQVRVSESSFGQTDATPKWREVNDFQSIDKLKLLGRYFQIKTWWTQEG